MELPPGPLEHAGKTGGTGLPAWVRNPLLPMPLYYKPFRGWRTVYPIARPSHPEPEIPLRPSENRLFGTRTVREPFIVPLTRSRPPGFHPRRLKRTATHPSNCPPILSRIPSGIPLETAPGPPGTDFTPETVLVFSVSKENRDGNRNETLPASGRAPVRRGPADARKTSASRT